MSRHRIDDNDVQAFALWIVFSALMIGAALIATSPY